MGPWIPYSSGTQEEGTSLGNLYASNIIGPATLTVERKRRAAGIPNVLSSEPETRRVAETASATPQS